MNHHTNQQRHGYRLTLVGVPACRRAGVPAARTIDSLLSILRTRQRRNRRSFEVARGAGGEGTGAAKRGQELQSFQLEPQKET